MDKEKLSRKILKFGCLPIVILIAIPVIIGIVNPDTDSSMHDDLIEQLNESENRGQFDYVITQLQKLANTTEEDSLKLIINSTIEGKELLWEDKLIQKQFSAWDGSHINLKATVKANLNNPSSFEHVETTYLKNNDHTLTINMKYRGANAFNAIVTESIWVKTDMKGTILEVLK